jgi:hypothetical protein
MKCLSNTRVSHRKPNILSTDLVFVIFGGISFTFSRILNIYLRRTKYVHQTLTILQHVSAHQSFYLQGVLSIAITVHSKWSIAQWVNNHLCFYHPCNRPLWERYYGHCEHSLMIEPVTTRNMLEIGYLLIRIFCAWKFGYAN